MNTFEHHQSSIDDKAFERAFCESLANIREEVGLSQADLDQKLGRVSGFVASLESGEQVIRPKMIADCARCLGKPVGKFFSKAIEALGGPRIISIEFVATDNGVSSEDVLLLLSSYAKINNAESRRTVMRLLSALASDEEHR